MYTHAFASLFFLAGATLSDLSFVLVKNGLEGFVELGIIAESLQTIEGPFLPSFRFTIPSDDEDDEDDDMDDGNETTNVIQSLREQMMTLFSKPEHVNAANCIKLYGSAAHVIQGGGDASHLEMGIDRLIRHYAGILNFFNNRYVFMVILDKISYGNPNRNRTPTKQTKKQQPSSPIQDLRTEIPKTYLHIPSGFDFRIGNSSMNREKVMFHYWPQRLVELSSFTGKFFALLICY